MRTKEGLRVEIRNLQIDYARAKAELSREIRSGRTMNLPRLGEVCHQILLSIAHRQGLLIEILNNEIAFSTVKEAA